MSTTDKVLLADGATVLVPSPHAKDKHDRIMVTRGQKLPAGIADGEAERLEALGALGTEEDLKALDYIGSIRAAMPTVAAEAERQVREDGVSYADAVAAVMAQPNAAIAGGSGTLPEAIDPAVAEEAGTVVETPGADIEDPPKASRSRSSSSK